MGYSNVFVSSPHPENLKTFFEFLFHGFDALEYKEHQDYDLLTSTNPAFGVGSIVRVNVFHSHRQTVQLRRKRFSVFRRFMFSFKDTFILRKLRQVSATPSSL
jgi:N-acetyltransferase 10